MREFLSEDFLLSTEASRRLYREFASPQPIVDYHCHLPAKDIAENRRFENLFEIWLEGDHYKWRAMRANGISERYCTGEATPHEKFLAWARTVPQTIRNPLYHWTHLELRRYFGISELLNESSAPSIWQCANALLANLSVHSILQKFKVQVICTSDDPCSDLRYHRAISESSLATRVFPTFRPDKAFAICQPAFRHWTAQLSAASNTDIGDLTAFLEALESRHAFFHSHGCRLSDHGLDHCYATPCSEHEAAQIFPKYALGER
jgi:glucuronate isomerase